MRAGDKVNPISLTPYADLWQSGGTTPRSGLKKYRSAQWSLNVSYGDLLNDETLIASLQHSDKPSPNANSHGLVGAVDYELELPDGIAVCIPFTANKNFTAEGLKFWLRREGDVSGYLVTNFYPDGGGHPSFGTPVGGANALADHLGISNLVQSDEDIPELNEFTEMYIKCLDGLDFTSGADYWAVLTLTQTATGSVYMACYEDNTSAAETYLLGVGYSTINSGTSSPAFILQECVFTGVEGAEIEVESRNPLTLCHPIITELDMNDVKDTVRVYYTMPDGDGLWVVSSEIICTDPTKSPVL